MFCFLFCFFFVFLIFCGHYWKSIFLFGGIILTLTLPGCCPGNEVLFRVITASHCRFKSSKMELMEASRRIFHQCDKFRNVFCKFFFLGFLVFFISFDGVKHLNPSVMSISLIILASVFTCIFWDARLECNLCICLHRFPGSSQSHEYKCSQSPMHSTSEHWLRQLSSLHVSESFSMVYEINSPRNKNLIF